MNEKRRQIVSRYFSSDYSPNYSQGKTAAQILNNGKLLVQWCTGDLQQLKNYNQFRKSGEICFWKLFLKYLFIR